MLDRVSDAAVISHLCVAIATLKKKTRTDFVQRPVALTTLRNKIKNNKIKDFI